MLTDQLYKVLHEFFIKIDASVGPKPRLRDTGRQYVTGCCTSAAGDKKRISRKGCRWRKEGVACRTDDGACVPSLGITSRRWRSVIIVTPLRHLVGYGTSDPILLPFPFVRSRPCSRARPAFFHDDDDHDVAVNSLRLLIDEERRLRTVK